MLMGRTSILLALASAVLLPGCVNIQVPPADARVDPYETTGALSRVDPYQATGALLGAAAGGLIGSQFGGGSGTAALTGLGAVAGAALGREVAKTIDRADRTAALKPAAPCRSYGGGRVFVCESPRPPLQVRQNVYAPKGCQCLESAANVAPPAQSVAELGRND